jgi:hypothetical protein
MLAAALVAARIQPQRPSVRFPQKHPARPTTPAPHFEDVAGKSALDFHLTCGGPEKRYIMESMCGSAGRISASRKRSVWCSFREPAQGLVGHDISRAFHIVEVRFLKPVEVEVVVIEVRILDSVRSGNRGLRMPPLLLLHILCPAGAPLKLVAVLQGDWR